MDSFNFSGKVAVVTGGTRGIGLATVKAFLRNGASVVLFGSRKETVEQTLNNLKADGPDTPVSGMWPDISQLSEVEAAFEQILAKHGHLDILVNNAGISQSQPLEAYTAEDFQKIMDINIKAVFNGCHAAAPIMKKQGGGVILSTSSMVSLYGQKSGCGYPISKFAVNGLTKSLARELGAFGIRVNAVAPGVTATDMVSALPEQYRQPLLNAIPMQRFGQAEDIANAFLFLASDFGGYINGAVLSVDGGIVM